MTPEQERAKAILTSELGKQMPSSAQHLCFETDLTAEAASGLMASLKAEAAPVVAAQTQTNSALDASIAEANRFEIVRDGNTGVGGIAARRRSAARLGLSSLRSLGKRPWQPPTLRSASRTEIGEPVMRLLDFASTQGWAMLPDHAEQMVAIAEREHSVTPEVLEAYRAQQLEKSERAGFRDRVAVLYVDGPLFKRANMFVRFSGATSYEVLRRDLQAAIDNPEVSSILVVADSPAARPTAATKSRLPFMRRGM